MGDAIAWYGAVLSTASLFVAFMAWRSSGPRTKARVLIVEPPDGRKLHVEVTNTGRADVSIDEICLAYGVPSPNSVLESLPRHIRAEPLEGPALPHRLLAGSSSTWCISPASLESKLGHQLERSDKIFAVVHTAHGNVKGDVVFPGAIIPVYVRRAAGWLDRFDRAIARLDERQRRWEGQGRERLRRWDERLDASESRHED